MNNRNNISQPIPKLLSEYTWAEIHDYLQVAHRNSPALHMGSINTRVKRHFGKLLTIDEQPLTYPYLHAFKALKKEEAEQIIPNFNQLINNKVNDGEYQSVLDIYRIIVDAISDGWTTYHQAVSKTFVANYFNVSVHALEIFLVRHSYQLKTLINHARNYLSERTQLTEHGDIKALQILEKQEEGFLNELNKIETKRHGKTAFSQRHHLDPNALKNGIIRQKTPLSQNHFITPTRQTVLKNPDPVMKELLDMPSIRKNKIQPIAEESEPVTSSFFNTTTQVMFATKTVEKRVHEAENNIANKRRRH